MEKYSEDGKIIGNPIDSQSYVIIECEPDQSKNDNCIQLRDNNKTIIYLKAGKNILTVEEYPGLKYGFTTFKKGVIFTKYSKINLSNFDGSEMKSMESMFERTAENIDNIIFGNIDTSKVENMAKMFQGSQLDNAVFKPFFNTSNVKNMERMFEGACFNTELDLSSFDVRNVNKMEKMFPVYYIKNLILDNWHIKGKEVVENIFTDIDNFAGEGRIPDIKISMKGCDVNTIQWICEDLIQFIDIYSEDILEDFREEFKQNHCANIMSHLILDEGILVHYDKRTHKIRVLTELASKSFAVIGCALNAEPSKNKIQFYDNYKTTIELQPGMNFLSVEEFPAIKYGFRPVKDEKEEFTNCENILYVDMSHFDWSEVRFLGSMFEGMKNLYYCNLSGVKLDHSVDIRNMFESACIENVIFDEWSTYQQSFDRIFGDTIYGFDTSSRISLKDCKLYMIDRIINQLYNFISESDTTDKDKFLKRFEVDEDIEIKYKEPSKCFVVSIKQHEN